jgi:hypothetical protein
LRPNLSGNALLGGLGKVMAHHLPASLTVDFLSGFGNPSHLQRLARCARQIFENGYLCRNTAIQIFVTILYLQHRNKYLRNLYDLVVFSSVYPVAQYLE